jgi:hypothetical protein
LVLDSLSHDRDQSDSTQARALTSGPDPVLRPARPERG